MVIIVRPQIRLWYLEIISARGRYPMVRAGGRGERARRAADEATYADAARARSGHEAVAVPDSTASQNAGHGNNTRAAQDQSKNQTTAAEPPRQHRAAAVEDKQVADQPSTPHRAVAAPGNSASPSRGSNNNRTAIPDHNSIGTYKQAAAEARGPSLRHDASGHSNRHHIQQAA